MRRHVLAVLSSSAALIAGFVALCVIYLAWTWNTGLGDMGGDNAYYLLMAQHFSPWSETSRAVAYHASHNPYPPLYPLLLAFVGGGSNILAAHFLTTMFLLAAFVCLYRWLRVENVSASLAGFVVLLFALLPGTYMQALSLLSENLYLLLSLAAVASVATYETTKNRTWLWGAAFFIAAAAVTRSAGISLLAAYALYLLLHRPPKYWLMALAAFFPFLMWNIFHHAGDVGYGAALYERYATISALTESINTQLSALWAAWIENFSSLRAAPPILAVLAVVSFIGTAVRLWRRKFDGFYVILYLSLILVWPYPDEATRFVFVLVPILLTHAVLFFQMVPTIRLGRRSLRTSYLLLSVCFLLVLPDISLTAQRFMTPLPDSLQEFNRDRAWYRGGLAEAREIIAFQEALIRGMRDLEPLVDEDDCIYSIKPSFVALFARRRSMFPPHPPATSNDDRGALADSNCRYYFMTIFVSPTFASPYYPLEQLKKTSWRVLRMSRASGDKRAVTILAERSN